MDRVRVGLVGCGGMGRRHLAAYGELLRSDQSNVELVALCDVDERNAEELADEARTVSGVRPRVFQSIATMVEAIDGLVGVDIAVDVRGHHRVAIECLEAGLHVLIEKPLALTVRACNLILRSAHRTGRILSVAESYRRDPMNRLVRALIDDGAIGDPHMMLESSVGGADRIYAQPWRHSKTHGGITLDQGTQSADVMRYFLGEAESAAGVVRLLQPVRRRADDGVPSAFYARSSGQVPETVRATAEDALWATIRFRNGAVAQWSFNAAGRGPRLAQRSVHGSEGAIAAPQDRSGRSPKLFRHGQSDAITDAALLEYAPSYALCQPAAKLFGDQRPTSYRMSAGEVDRKVIALELHEFADCVRQGARPEVTGDEGRRDVALVYAVCESSMSNRFVTLDEVEEVRVDQYQREIDADLGLIEASGLA